MRILIAVPTFETITPETFRSIYNLHSKHDLDFEFFKGYDCAIARNAIVQYALEGEYDYVLMVDSDMIIPWNTLDLMLETDIDVCLGIYPKKNTVNGTSTIVKPNTQNYNNYFNYSELPKENKFPVKGGGFGCALISKKVLETLSYPYFKYVVYDNGTFLSEDFYFCNKVREAGFKIEADNRVRCGHLMRKFQYE